MQATEVKNVKGVIKSYFPKKKIGFIQVDGEERDTYFAIEDIDFNLLVGKEVNFNQLIFPDKKKQAKFIK